MSADAETSTQGLAAAERTDAAAHANVAVAPDGIATVTINGAGALNILNTAATDGLRETFVWLRGQPEVRVVILRGAGERAFVAGADIAEMAGLDDARGRRFIANLRALCDEVRNFPVPVIARIAGWCLGGGLELAAACDLRVCAEQAKFGMPEIKMGIPSVVHAALLPRLIGAANAAWLLLTGETIDARRALAWGLVHDAVPPDRLDDAALQLARGIAALGPAVVRQQKRLLRRWETLSVDAAIEDSIAEFGAAFDTGEPQQYMGAFLARVRAKKS